MIKISQPRREYSRQRKTQCENTDNRHNLGLLKGRRPLQLEHAEDEKAGCIETDRLEWRVWV